MRIITIKSKEHESKVYVIDEKKLIYKIDCTCGDFSGAYTPRKAINKICSKESICESCKESKNESGCGKEFEIIKNASWYSGRRMYNSGLFADQKFFAIPCKHLKTIVQALESQGYTLKKPKPMTGTDKCTVELRRFIYKRSGGMCEMIGCSHPGIEIHRKVPKTNGGKYNEDNCILLCLDCHHNVTYQKWQGSPGAKK